MKIAVATDDFKTVTGHVGRCNGFVVFEIKDGKIANKENRENNFTNHHHGNHHHHSNEHEHNSTHGNLLSGLKDCSHLICTSAGWRLQEDFTNNGKQLIFTNEELAEDAAIKLFEGTLEINEEGSCHSH
ncbi:MAG: iron-molybdenum cofactor biosynthesis protein [Ignavibacteriae bacterium]|nr:iron-molybdenum cofactor biosynthesis protein [Ignavibacteriota bacterium]